LQRARTFPGASRTRTDATPPPFLRAGGGEVRRDGRADRGCARRGTCGRVATLGGVLYCSCLLRSAGLRGGATSRPNAPRLPDTRVPARPTQVRVLVRGAVAGRAVDADPYIVLLIAAR